MNHRNYLSILYLAACFAYMTKNLNRLRVCILMLPVLPFGISLTQVAFINQYGNEIQVHSGISLLVMGPTLILGGGGLEWLTWMANPLAIWVGYRFFIQTKPTVLKNLNFKIDYRNVGLSIIAAAIAWSFSFWDEVLAAESGTTGKILSFGSGYWLWASSILLLAIGISSFACLIWLRNLKPNH